MLRTTLPIKRPALQACPGNPRRGSALLIVVVLLAMLTGLGVIFYVFSAQERKTAEYYSEAAKATEFDLSVDSLMDFGLEQLIVGPAPYYRNSALFGRRHSMIPNMLGLDSTGQRIDLTPFNGTPFKSGVDAKYWNINDSPVANNGNDPDYQAIANRDPDYTYPDVNNVFISYTGYTPTGELVIIPSFHRPQNLRGATWYSDPTSVNMLLRPHPGHVYVSPPGQQLGNFSRFIQTDSEAVSLFGAGAKAFPFFPNDSNNDGQNGQGVWNGAVNYEYDVDNDGDGIPEGVWLDLDFPVQETIDGKQYVPLYSMTVIDADALLNLNVHGNLTRVWNGNMELTATNSAFVNSQIDPSVSVSNLGVLPAEVNPIWGLNRRPSGSVQISEGSYANDGFFGTANPINWHESANRELSFLLLGKYSTNPTDLVPGRWGEESFLYKAITNGTSRQTNAFSYDLSGNPLQNPWPGPGQTQIDDNGDAQQVTGAFYGANFARFGHPMDFSGLGSYYVGKNANYGLAGLARWPTYSQYSNGSPAAAWTAMTNSIQNALFNDGAETIVDSDNLRTEDAQFGPDEMRALFMNSTDFQAYVGTSSRLTSLAPFNLDTTVSNFLTTYLVPPNPTVPSRNTQSFRSKFTTRSWDRKQFSISRNSLTRPWEFTADADNNNYPEFPPILGGVHTEYSSTDLFRPVTRLLLETESNIVIDSTLPSNPSNAFRRSMRLNVNQLLVGPNGNPYPTVSPPPASTASRVPKFDISFRPLTPHPDPTTLAPDPVSTVVQNRYGATGNVQNSYPANGNFAGDAQLQEYWARCDRQLLARDIFAILYITGWPDGINPGPTIGAYSSLVLDDSTDGVQNQFLLREMAQFAVNLVDSLDGDNIPTRFEYDLHPLNGWNVDDDPYTTSTSTEPERGEVWGVEHLDLTLSEALVVNIPANTDGDLTFTQWDDSKKQNFCYVELRNPSLNSVDLSNQAWRIEVGPDYASTLDPSLDQVRRLKLLNGTIASGALFTIGSTDKTTGGTHPSIMKISHTGTAPSNWDTDMTSWIAPAQLPLDLDLKDASSASRFNLTDATGGAVSSGALFDGSTTLNDVYVRLYRRASPDRQAPTSALQEADNPYVMVDQIHIDNVQTDPRSGNGSKLTLMKTDKQADIEQCLTNLTSLQTREPFFGPDRTTRAGAAPNAAAYYANTLAADNTSTLKAVPQNFTRWQKVFDRSFASLGEVLQLTVGGFSNTEDLRKRAGTSLATAISVAGDSAAAEERFIKQGSTVNAGRWYRLLEFLEVPTREHVGIPGLAAALEFPRVPGKININMLRHPEVLAGLIDDPRIMSVQVDEDVNFNGTLDPGEDLNNDGTINTFDPPRVVRTDLTITPTPPNPYATNLTDWWRGFLLARDGNRGGGTTIQPDPDSGLYLPGVATAHPFRSFTSAVSSYTSNEDTVLRSWPEDQINIATGGTNDPRQLFELGTQDEHLGHDATGSSSPVAKLDPYVRRRVLSKLMNNITTRSNVFVVFMTVKNFRADTSTGAVRIGGPLSSEVHRGFFVIDRSQLEKAYDQSTNSFNFRSFIEFRQVLQ